MTILSQHDPNTQDVPQFASIEPEPKRLDVDGVTYFVTSLTNHCHILESEDGRLVGQFREMVHLYRFVRYAELH